MEDTKDETCDRLLSLLLGSPHQATPGGSSLGTCLPTRAVQDEQKLRPHILHEMIKDSD